MPEEQTPFVHQDGSATSIDTAAAHALLRPTALRRQADDLAALATDMPTRVARTAPVLKLLQEPTVNTTVAAMQALDDTSRALVSNVAAALWVAGRRRPRLVAELRALLEKQP